MRLRDYVLGCWMALVTAWCVVVTREIRIIHARQRKLGKRVKTVEQAEGLTGTEYSVRGVPNINRMALQKTETWWQRVVNRVGKWWRSWR